MCTLERLGTRPLMKLVASALAGAMSIGGYDRQRTHTHTDPEFIALR